MFSEMSPSFSIFKFPYLHSFKFKMLNMLMGTTINEESLNYKYSEVLYLTHCRSLLIFVGPLLSEFLQIWQAHSISRNLVLFREFPFSIYMKSASHFWSQWDEPASICRREEESCTHQCPNLSKLSPSGLWVSDPPLTQRVWVQSHQPPFHMEGNPATDAGSATFSKFDSLSIYTTLAFSFNFPHCWLIQYGQTIKTFHGLPWNFPPSVHLGWELASSFGKRILRESEVCHFLGKVMRSHCSVPSRPGLQRPRGGLRCKLREAT